MKVVDLECVVAEGLSHDPAILKRVLLRSGEVPHLTQLAQATFAPGQMAPSHAHSDMWEIFWCTAGEGSLRVAERDIPLCAGRCVVVEPGEHHELRNSGTTPLLVIVAGLLMDG